jgi:hypothetical protein
MSISIPPPDYQFNGLFYNPNFWINATDGLTQADANQLYLRKTTTDSASALETFNGGIKTASIDVTAGGSLATMFSSQTAGANLFGNLGSGSTLRLGNQTTAQSVHVSQIDCKASSINNIVNDTGAITIGGKQTTGFLYLGGGEGIPRSGQIQIGTVANTTCSILIGSSVGVGGNITIRRPLTFDYVNTPFIATQLGFRSQLVTNGTVTTSGTAGTITQWASFTVPVGVWMYEAVLFIPASISNVEWYISSTTATADSTRLCGGVSVAGSGVGSRACGIIQQATASATWYLNGKSTVASVSIININVCLTRIA